MRVVVGLDLRPAGRGALRFARWLLDVGATRPEDILAVHVVENDHLVASLEPIGVGTLPGALLPRSREALAEAGLPESVRCEVLERDNAETALVEVCERHQADLLLVGRRGTPSSMVRLGRVARRLLRRLPTAVGVLPPTLQQDRIGPGPLVLATDMTPAMEGAARFASGLAPAAGGLLVAHVVPTRAEPHTAYLRSGAVARPQAEVDSEHERHLATWAKDHGLAEAPRTIARGELVEELCTLGRDRGAAALVFGSRRLGMAERLFVTSASSTASGLAEVPVITVP